MLRSGTQAVPDTVFADLDAALIAEFRASRIAPVKDGIAIAA